MPFTAVGAVSAIVAFPTQVWNAGSKTVGPIPIAAKFRNGWLLVDLTQLTDLLCDIAVTIELSMDGGTNWTTIGGWGLNLPLSGLLLVGGVLQDPSGNPIRVTWSAVRLPVSVSAVRQLRATATLSTQATVGCTFVMW